MNAEQQYEILKRVDELIGARARVSFRTSNTIDPCLTISMTGTGYQISEIHHCKRIESCYQIYDYNTAIKVLNKIIQQAKLN